MTGNWRRLGACTRLPLPWDVIDSIFFPSKGSAAEATRICGACPVADRCLADALTAGPTLPGVYGGTGERERQRILGAGPGAHDDTHRRRYRPEVRVRAVRLYASGRLMYPSDYACMTAVAKTIGATAEVVRTWVRAAEAATEATQAP